MHVVRGPRPQEGVDGERGAPYTEAGQVVRVHPLSPVLALPMLRQTFLFADPEIKLDGDGTCKNKARWTDRQTDRGEKETFFKDPLRHSLFQGS